jgi:hypothetical protein
MGLQTTGCGRGAEGRISRQGGESNHEGHEGHEGGAEAERDDSRALFGGPHSFPPMRYALLQENG